MQRDLASLLDILQSAQLIQVYLLNIDLDSFLRDRKSQDAVVRRIEVIGEAVRRISAEFRAAHPEIPWQDMAGMRSKLIHDYDRVNLMQVWDTVQRDIPTLINLIEPLVPPDEPDKHGSS